MSLFFIPQRLLKIPKATKTQGMSGFSPLGNKGGSLFFCLFLRAAALE